MHGLSARWKAHLEGKGVKFEAFSSQLGIYFPARSSISPQGARSEIRIQEVYAHHWVESERAPLRVADNMRQYSRNTAATGKEATKLEARELTQLAF